MYVFLAESVARPVVLALAALPLMGLFPFNFWRVDSWLEKARFAPLLYGLPVLTALKLFTRQPDFAIEAGAIWLAPWGVIALAVVTLAAWSGRGSAAGKMALLSCSGVFVWLAGSFAGPEAALAEGRGLLIAGAGLVILPHFPTPRVWQRVPKWLLAATMIGIPLTAGGYGRGLLYEGLLSSGMSGAWLLVSILSVASTALWLDWALGEERVTPQPTSVNNPLTRFIPWLFVLALLPTLGQIGGLSALSLNSWLAVLLPLITAGALTYVRQQRPELSWNPSHLGKGWRTFQEQFGEAGSLMRGAVGEAWPYFRR